MADFVSLQDFKVLVVDDNRHMRHIVRSILGALGCVYVRECGDAAAAFKELKNTPFDLAIVDWKMDPLDGIDFTKLVRTAKDSPNPYIPIIMLSAYTEYRRISEARDAGVNEFLAKPISVSNVGRRIASVISHPRNFIRTKGYFGPCRRRSDMGPPRGVSDRRQEVPEEAHR
ncbi:MAG: response regulator [Rhodospirillaceae bacterium]|jgi:two-component system, chemotaxis family, chemotaxis protein CheY|nr:response regulator [Rhodospirillaceae bacterium]MBT5458647.1 response regulator [Rhodospirillaceae bacterium]MBT6886395.1 response regulator [Rhodospirillaceae bacterium]